MPFLCCCGKGTTEDKADTSARIGQDVPCRVPEKQSAAPKTASIRSHNTRRSNEEPHTVGRNTPFGIGGIDETAARPTTITAHDAGSRPASRTADKQAVDASRQNLWDKAFRALDVSQRKELTALGFTQDPGSQKSNIKDVIQTVSDKQKEVEEKQLAVTVNGEKAVLRQYTQEIIGWLTTAGDIAVQFAPPQAAAPWSVLKGLMNIAIIESEQMDALLQVTAWLVRLFNRGEVYETVYLRDQSGMIRSLDTMSTQLLENLTNAYKLALELLWETATLLKENTVKRGFKALYNRGSVPNGLKELESQVSRLGGDVSALEARRCKDANDNMTAMLARLDAPIARADRGIAHLVEGLDGNQLIEMLEWISPIPFEEHHHNVTDKRAPGTGQWILQNETFRDWEGRADSSIFLLQGTAGTGKTYLTSTVIDRFKIDIKATDKDEGAAYFYCDNNEPVRTQPLSILQSYVRQLATPRRLPESVQTALEKTYQDTRKEGSTFKFDQCRAQILAFANIYSRTTLVIDALDECDPSGVDRLIDALNELIRDSVKPVRIFISSRPNPDIHLERVSRLDIEAGGNRDDIRRYLSGELDKLTSKASFFAKIKSEIIEKLLEKSQSMFQYAALQISQIGTCRTQSSVKNRLEHLPEGLEAAYDEVWARIMQHEEPDRTLSKRALLWVMCAQKPMSSEELLAAVRVTADAESNIELEDEINEDALLSLCKDVLVVDSQQEVWRFTHLSVQEYLVDKDLLTLPQAHNAAAVVLLSLLNNAVDTQDEQSVDADDDLTEATGTTNVVSADHRLQIYATVNWGLHAREAQRYENCTASPILKKFLGSPNRSSAMFSSWFGRYVDATYLYLAPFDDSDSRQVGPKSQAAFAMCHYSLDTILADWWESAEINLSMVNDLNHSLLIVAVLTGSLPIVQHLLRRGVDVAAKSHYGWYGSALVAAAHGNHINVAKALVEAGANINESFGENEGLFHNALAAAVIEGNLEMTMFLVASQAEIHTQSPRRDGKPNELYRNVLGYAAARPNIAILKYLLQAGADPNVPMFPTEEGSALTMAAEHGYLENVQILVEEGKADVNAMLSTWTLGSALEAAAVGSSDRLAIVQYLILHGGADVNLRTSSTYGSALAAAASAEDGSDIVESLLQFGADVNLVLSAGSYGSALVAAAAKGRLEAISKLVNAGADINALVMVGNYGSALAAAAFQGGSAAVSYLLEAGADVTLELPAGWFGSALAAAAYSLNHECVTALLERGADVNKSLSIGMFGSALAAAVAGDSLVGRGANMAQALIDAGADVNLPLPNQQDNIFVAAARVGELDAFEMILDAGASPHLLLHATVLVAVIESRNTWLKLRLLQRLVDAGADLNEQALYQAYGSILALAAGTGTDAVPFLLENGADPNLQLVHGDYKNALEAASDSEVAELLVAAGAVDVTSSKS